MIRLARSKVAFKSDGKLYTVRLGGTEFEMTRGTAEDLATVIMTMLSLQKPTAWILAENVLQKGGEEAEQKQLTLGDFFGGKSDAH